MKSATHFFQLLVMGVIVYATNVDVVTDGFNARYAANCITHFLLEDFCSTRETKVETLVAKQQNMSGECGKES